MCFRILWRNGAGCKQGFSLDLRFVGQRKGENLQPYVVIKNREQLIKYLSSTK